MPTKKKRVGFIPRVDVMRLINKLSIENNLSNSKIVSILVEEALSMRGIFNKKNGKITQSFRLIEDQAKNLSENSNCFIDNAESTNLKEASKETFDLQTYEKFLLFLKFQEMTNKYNS